MRKTHQDIVNERNMKKRIQRGALISNLRILNVSRFLEGKSTVLKTSYAIYRGKIDIEDYIKYLTKDLFSLEMTDRGNRLVQIKYTF